MDHIQFHVPQHQEEVSNLHVLAISVEKGAIIYDNKSYTDRELQVRDLKTLALMKNYKFTNVRNCKLSFDQKLLTFIDNFYNLHVFDLQTNKELFSIILKSDKNNEMISYMWCIAKNNQFIVTSFSSMALKVWDMTGKEIKSIPIYKPENLDISRFQQVLELINITFDNKYIYFFNTNKILSVVNLETGERIHDFYSIDYMGVSYDCITVTPDNKYIFVIMYKIIRIFDFENGNKIGELPKDDSTDKGYATIFVSQDNNYFITGPEFGLLRVWDLKTLNLLFVVDCYTKRNFNLDNVLRIYYINSNTILTFDNERAPITYKIYMPGTPPPNFDEESKLSKVISFASAPDRNASKMPEPVSESKLLEQVPKGENNNTHELTATNSQTNKKCCTIL